MSNNTEDQRPVIRTDGTSLYLVQGQKKTLIWALIPLDPDKVEEVNRLSAEMKARNKARRIAKKTYRQRQTDLAIANWERVKSGGSGVCHA